MPSTGFYTCGAVLTLQDTAAGSALEAVCYSMRFSQHFDTLALLVLTRPTSPACYTSHTRGGGGGGGGPKGREGKRLVMHATEPLGLLSAALVFPIGFDSTGAPFALQLSAPAGMDGFLMSLGLALEKLFGPMPAPPSTAACSGCSSNVFYTNVSLTHSCCGPGCKSLHSQCTNPKPFLLTWIQG